MPAITAAAARTAMIMLLPPPIFEVRATGAPARGATVDAVTERRLAAGAAAAMVGTATSDRAKTADVANLVTLI